MQPVPDDRTTSRQADQITRVVWLCIGGALLGLNYAIRCHQALVLKREERIALPGVAAGLGRGDDDATRCLLVLCLVVLRDHPELLHRVAGEEVAAGSVLADYAAPHDVALVARAVNEDVDLVGPVRRRGSRTGCSGDEAFLRGVDLVVLRGAAGRERGQVENVPGAGGQIIDLLLGHVGCSFGGAHLDACRRRSDSYRFELDCGGAELVVQREHFADQDTHMHLLRRHADLARGNVVFGGHEAEHGVEAVALRRDFALRRRQSVHRDAAGSRDRRAARVGHVSPDAPRAGLRRGVARERHGQHAAKQQHKKDSHGAFPPLPPLSRAAATLSSQHGVYQWHDDRVDWDATDQPFNATIPMTPMRPHHTLCIVVTLALGGGVSTTLAAQTPAPVRNIDSLLARMTLEEKLGQLNQLSVDNRPNAEQLDLVRKGLVGSFLNLTGAAATRDAQHIAVTESRLRIPLIFGHDVIHGYRTIFPIPLGETASWDPDAVEAAARVAAREAAAAGLHWTFAPMVDIARDPRWGRIAEGSGEDPYLGSAMAAARVRGFQGADPRAPDAVLATVKHFAAYGGAEGGRDYNTVDLSERTLREVYLPPYHAAMDAGAATVMTSFNEIGGIPSTASPWLMTTLLRREWGFRGFVVSDWTAVEELRNHGVAGSRAEAGVDMDMVSRIYVNDLPALVRAGRIPMAVVNEAVRRVLRAKAALGLFDDPYHGATPERERAALLAPEHRQLARRVAEESIVLLKNDGQRLPLGASVKTIAVIGPLADDKVSALGSWPGRGGEAGGRRGAGAGRSRGHERRSRESRQYRPPRCAAAAARGRSRNWYARRARADERSAAHDTLGRGARPRDSRVLVPRGRD